jgi:thiol:disulfide interchange protein
MKFPVRQAISILCIAMAGASAPCAAVAASPLYPAPSRARGDLRAAIAQAGREHKHILVDFGADWCGDCLVLESSFRSPDNAPLLETGYVLVHVNIGELDRNVELAEQYGIALKEGVPALAVLDSEGALLHSLRNGEEQAMNRTDPHSVNEFLTRWKPQPVEPSRAP